MQEVNALWQRLVLLYNWYNMVSTIRLKNIVIRLKKVPHPLKRGCRRFKKFHSICLSFPMVFEIFRGLFVSPPYSSQA